LNLSVKLPATEIVVSYINPDLDGVSSAIGYSAWAQLEHRRRVLPAVIGKIDLETELVLDRLKIRRPPVLNSFSNVRAIVLVDTHHKSQLPEDFPWRLVVEVLDHHTTDGDPDLVPQASITNEPVGATATLVAERFSGEAAPISASIARLLGCGIISSTYGLTAPSTTARDHLALEWLAARAPVSAELSASMRAARRLLLDMCSIDLVEADLKTVKTQHGRIIIAQVEADGAATAAQRTDLVDALNVAKEVRDAQYALLNLVDTRAGYSVIVSGDAFVWDILKEQLVIQMQGTCMGRAGGLLMRKTHLVPIFASHGSEPSRSSVRRDDEHA
jgi:manganese-dependent inorganic pyrophosphatase